jgi:HAD superfamily hydrolase (TIGR01509 family)
MAERRILAVLLDFGDTLSDQATEDRDEAGFMHDVELLDGARELLIALRERGYKTALVADGEAEESALLRARHGLEDLFDAVAISDEVGAEKPDAEIFRVALERLGLPPAAAGRVVMVGNRLERDVAGARALGMTAVWIDATPRYRKAPAGPEEAPDRVIHAPLELLGVLEDLERP